MEYYVDCHGAAGGDGSRARPFRTIGQAAALARAGDTVLVLPGVYREWVNPAHGGTEEARIVYRSVEPGGAVISGAEPVTGWTRYQGDTWTVELPNELFGDYNPYAVPVTGDWYYGKRVVHTGEVYFDDWALYEAESLEEVLAGTPWVGDWGLEPEDHTACRWFAQVTAQTTRIYANFGGRNPADGAVEIHVRRRCFFPSEPGRSYLTVSGFTFCRAAPTWAPPTAFQDGMVGVHWSKGWIIEDCELFQSKCSGLSLGKYLQPGNENKWSGGARKSGTQNERDVICRAVNEGWTKETVGSHLVRRCQIHHCGQTGIVGHLGCAFSRIEDNHIHHINNRQELDGAEIGGIKLHAALDVQILRNHIHHCTRGLWLDWQAQGTRVSCNLMHHNAPPVGVGLLYHLALGEDIFVEVSHGPTLLDHNLLLSPFACRLSTQGVVLAHNLIAGSFTKVGEGTVNGGLQRFTPYHEPHGTKINGFATILHGDMQFYNNIFLQQPERRDLDGDRARLHITFNDRVGTAVYDGYPSPAEFEARYADGNLFDYDRYNLPLPVTAAGNVYAGGAAACRTETDARVRPEPAAWRLEERGGGWYFSLSGLEDPGRGSLVDTARMGLAFEPEQPFEAPDGSPIALDRDYLGQKSAPSPRVGPFETIPTEAVRVW